MDVTAKVKFAESAEVTLGREQRSADVEGKRAIPETLGNRKQSAYIHSVCMYAQLI
jgi:hypothetical protein